MACWLHGKLLAIVVLLVCHFYMDVLMKRFSGGKNNKDQRFFRIFNEVPTLLMVIIVILVVVKPF
jgi:putative membrane protein